MCYIVFYRSRGLGSEIVEELKRADSFFQRNYDKIGFTLFLASSLTIIAFYFGTKKNSLFKLPKLFSLNITL